MERLEPVLHELLRKSLPVDDKAYLAAHHSVLETQRRLCATDFSEDNQPHVESGVVYIIGFEDSAKMGPAVAYDIPGHKAWRIYCDYVNQVNAQLQKNREDLVAKITVIVTSATPSFPQLAELSEEFRFNIEDICDAVWVDSALACLTEMQAKKMMS